MMLQHCYGSAFQKEHRPLAPLGNGVELKKVSTLAATAVSNLDQIASFMNESSGGGRLGNWVNVIFERLMHTCPVVLFTLLGGMKSPIYVAPNVMEIGIDGPAVVQGPPMVGTVGVAVAVNLVPFGIVTPMRLVTVLSKVKDGLPPHVSVCAVSAKPGHPVVDVGGTVGHAKDTVEPLGYGVGTGPG